MTHDGSPRRKPGPVRRIGAWVVSFFRGLDQVHREKMTSLTAFEARELENMFVLLLLGSFAGMPSPPSFLAVELLPHLEHEIRVLNRRAESSTDALAEIMGSLDADA
ncbi:MAG: hypothetical protein MI724_15150 [Spirochaetales bacterium]|nr:hypothetical protein [Spirochaetales bacterium]